MRIFYTEKDYLQSHSKIKLLEHANMTVKILIDEKNPTHKIASGEFNRIYQAVTGKSLPVISEDDEKSDLIVLGSDNDNLFVHFLVMHNGIRIPKAKVMSDEYEFIYCEKNGRKIQILAGGRPRSLLYAVYRFFEITAGCRYFWDKDIIPENSNLQLFGLKKYEKPRFKYRGMAYCPHRSLKRFQPEQWEYEDWVKEIDYVLKKRFNTFWMRLGIEDIFMKAFPGIVEDPRYECPGAPVHSYDDRRLLHPVSWKAQLRKKVMQYAFERDLLHPEEAGAFTHWDTYTPQSFLDKVNPTLMNDATNAKLDKRHIHLDISEDINLDYYFRVTKASIDNYGRPEIFYVRGISERICSTSHEENIKFKIYCYKRIIAKLRTEYPYAEIWFHSWDLMCNKWTPSDVRDLLNVIDNDPNIHMLSFTNDVEAGMNAITEWGVPHNFPYILGFFVANMPDSEIQGNFDMMENRLAIALKDPCCHGLVLWPEASHVDNFIQEYISVNAWEEGYEKADDFVERFCEARYPLPLQEKMKKIWHNALAIYRKRRKIYRDPNNLISGHRLNAQLGCSYIFDERDIIRSRNCFNNYFPPLENAETLFQEFALLIKNVTLEEFIKQDIRDLAKSVLLCCTECTFAATVLLMEFWRNERTQTAKEKLLEVLKLRKEYLFLYAELLAAHKENSLYDSMLAVIHSPAGDHNPEVEEILKGNADNTYCRGHIAELAKYCYIPEGDVFCQWVEESLEKGFEGRWKKPEIFTIKRKEISQKFMDTPLAEMAPDVEKARAALPETFAGLAKTEEKRKEIGKFVTAIL